MRVQGLGFVVTLILAVFGALGCSVVVDGPAAAADAGPETSNDAGDAGTIEAAVPAPQLTSLTILPGILTPDFSPSIHDYTVACDIGDNAWSVAATVAAGAKLVIAGEETTATAVDLVVAENDAVVVRVETSSAATEYWVRCLAHDFPVVWPTRTGATSPGYYLVGNAVAQGGYGPYAMVLDGNGTPVWYHHGTAGHGVVSVESPGFGAIAFINSTGGFGHEPDAAFDVYALQPWTITHVQAVGTPTDQHELVTLPNGHHLTFSYAPKTGVDLTGLGGFGTNQTIADCAIQDIDETGALTWQWFASEHIDAVTESVEYPVTVLGNVPYVDVFHCNSIEADPAGNLIVSARHLDAVFKIDRATGKLLWKLGGKPVNKDGAAIMSFVNETQGGFFHQHDARLLPNGHLTVFDDHGSQIGVARGVEYALDETAKTATLVWEARDTQASSAMGSTRRQADGATVIGWGWPANGTGHVLTEFDPEGNVLFDVEFAKGNMSYRAIKVPPSQFDLEVLRRTAGMP